MDLRQELAPKGLKFNPNNFIISDKYATVLTVIAYPGIIGPGFLASITNMSGIKISIKHIPLPFSSMSKMLNKQIAELKIKYQEENDKTSQERIRQDYESLETFIKMLAAEQSKVFDFQMHIMITANSLEELESKKVNVKNYLDAMQMRAIPMLFEQEAVLKSMMPIYPKQEIERRIGTPIPTPTVAAMYPFIFDSIKDEGLSCLLGVDFSGGIILFNQFLFQIKKEYNRNNGNMIILGTSGSGKSTAAKLLLRSYIRNEYQIVAIDPENELYEMTKMYGGDSIDLGRGGEFGMINPLEIILDADEEEASRGAGYTVLTRTLQSLKAFMKYYAPDVEEDVLTLFSEVVQDTYARFQITFNTDFSKLTSEDYPTFKDVYATIMGRLQSASIQGHEKDVMERLELKIRPLTKELQYYFNGHTTVQSESEFIVFNIREIMNADTNIRNALFFNILKYAWGLCLDRNKNTVLIVDEAHVLLDGKNTIGADFLGQVQRRARKYNTGTTIITQQPSDFSNDDVIMQGKAIFDNASYYLVMNLKKQAVTDLSRLIDLNENEIESIKRYNQGEALLICGTRRMRIRVMVTEQELEAFGSRGGL